jgi:DNA-binding response OmpR family regulator
MRVLLVEDAPNLRESLVAALRRSGYAVDAAKDGAEVLTMASTVPYDVVVLDIVLPRIDGLEVLRRARESGLDAPVLLLTARSNVADRVIGLNLGAEDYLGKPFSLDELLARVQALGRRRHGQSKPVIELGSVSVDTAAKRVQCDGKAVELAPREYALIEYLAFRRGTVVSRSEIEAHIYDDLADPMSNVVDSAVCVLRKRLSDAGAPPLIQTRRGLGYCLEAPESCAPLADN